MAPSVESNLKICPFCLKPNATGKCMNRVCVAGALNLNRKAPPVLVRLK